MKLGINIEDVQKRNRCIVLQALMEHSEISRVDLVRITNLNKATITNIIQNFLDLGIVKNVGSITSSNGRKVAGLSLCMEDTVSIVLCIRKSHFRTAICNIKGEISNCRDIRYKDGEDLSKVLEQYEEALLQQLSYCRERGLRILGISVATLGWLMKKENSYYMKVDDVKIFDGVDIKRLIQEMFPDYEVWVEHDAKACALAEWNELGKTSEYKPESLLCIVGGLGFGGGIVINGEVFSGYNGIAGEVGHLGVNCNTRKYSKRQDYAGLWEEYASPTSIQERVQEHLWEYPDTVLHEEATLDEIYAAYEKGDALAEWAMNQSAHYMAYGLVGLTYVINPEVIIFSDEVIQSEKFEAQLRSEMKGLLPDVLYETLNIRFSSLGKDGIMIGAGLAMTKHYLRTYQMIDFINENYAG